MLYTVISEMEFQTKAFICSVFKFSKIKIHVVHVYADHSVPDNTSTVRRATQTGRLSEEQV